MSLIWSISKDVLSSIWSLPAKRLMTIFLRLSVVVGVIVAGATFATMYIHHKSFVDNQIAERLKLHYALRCAQRLPDDILLRHEEKPAGRNIDLSKLGCADNAYWTNLLEIRAALDQPRIPTETFDAIYRLNVDPVAAVAGGIFSMVLVNALSVLLVVLRRIAMWTLVPSGPDQQSARHAPTPRAPSSCLGPTLGLLGVETPRRQSLPGLVNP